jgi:hypothetical protein
MNVLDGPSEVCHHRERSPRLLRRSVEPAPITVRPNPDAGRTLRSVGTGTFGMGATLTEPPPRARTAP